MVCLMLHLWVLLAGVCELQHGVLTMYLLLQLRDSGLKTIQHNMFCLFLFPINHKDKTSPEVDTCSDDQTVVLPSDGTNNNNATVPVTIDSSAFFEMAGGVTINDMNYESGA